MKQLLAISALIGLFSISAFASDHTNCEATKIGDVFPNEYSQADSAYCQTGTNATFMLTMLMGSAEERKAEFMSGADALSKLSGFTAIALAGYTLDSGMVFTIGDERYIAVRFSTDKSTDVKYYKAVYKLEKSVPKITTSPKN